MSELVPLKRVATIVAGQSPPSDEVSDWDGSGLAFLQGNAEFGPFHPSPRHQCEAAPKTCEPGDILLSVRAPVGALNTADRRYGIGRGLCAIRPTSDLYKTFAWWLMVAMAPGLAPVATGSTYDAVTADDVGTLRVPVPPLAAQRDIATYLDHEIGRLDGLVSAKQRMIKLADEREHAQISVATVPSDCRFARLGYFATVQGGITVDAGRDPGRDMVLRPYLRVANVQAGRLDLAEVSEIPVSAALAARSTLREFDVLMTEGGDIDKLGRGTVWQGEIPCCLHQNHIFAVRPERCSLDSWYLGFLTRSSHARDYFESTGVQSTNLASTSASKIAAFPIPVIPLAEQRGIVAELTESGSANSVLRAKLEHQCQLLGEHRQALITAAVTGQLSIPEAA